MNVLHISESDGGGRRRAARRNKLHAGLVRGSATRSQMLVGRKMTRDDDVRPLKRDPLWRGLDRATGRRSRSALSLQYVFYPSSFGVLRATRGSAPPTSSSSTTCTGATSASPRCRRSRRGRRSCGSCTTSGR